MIDQETLNKVLLNIDKIQEIVTKHGFKDVSIFKPLSFADSKKLNFVAAQNFEGVIDFFRISDMESELSKILNCKILFFPENSINTVFKESVMESKLLLIEDNKEKISYFFHDVLKIKKEIYFNSKETLFNPPNDNLEEKRKLPAEEKKPKLDIVLF